MSQAQPPHTNETHSDEPWKPNASVLIVCDNDDTLIGLRDYLCGAGIAASATRDLATALKQSEAVDAVVVFPDDFDTEEVTDGFSVLLMKPGALVVAVTADSRRFGALVPRTGQSRLVIMPRPVWGWIILDALRGSLEGST